MMSATTRRRRASNSNTQNALLTGLSLSSLSGTAADPDSRKGMKRRRPGPGMLCLAQNPHSRLSFSELFTRPPPSHTTVFVALAIPPFGLLARRVPPSVSVYLSPKPECLFFPSFRLSSFSSVLSCSPLPVLRCFSFLLTRRVLFLLRLIL